MATGPITQISDVVVPEIFTPYVQQRTEEKSRIIASGALVRDGALDSHLAGGGLTFNSPSFVDLDNDEDNVSQDDADDRYTGGSENSEPKKVRTTAETSVRLSRNQSWSSSDLTSALAGADPMDSIVERVSDYWVRRLQVAYVATMKGVFSNNAQAPIANEHVIDDMTNDISGVAYAQGETDFAAPAFLDATVTLGDSMDDLGLILVHSIVYNRMQKNGLIEVLQDQVTGVKIPTFLGRTVVVDDGMPSADGVFESWMFGGNAVRLGMGTPKVATETKRDPDAGKGGGAEILYNRTEWAIHPAGYKYNGSPEDGGPNNTATTDNLAHPDSWKRVFGERKMIKLARLVSREYATA